MEHLCLFHKAHVNIDNLYNHYYQLIQHDETRQYRL
jgi:hypothetical protein